MKKAYDSCTLSLIDGMPLVWTYRLLKKRKVVKVSGSDVFSYLLPILVKKNKKIFLLGGEEGVAKNAVNNLCSDINHRIFTYSPPFGFEKKSNQNYIILDKINKIKPDILFVAFGAPKQEKWIYANLKKINAKIAIGVGGSFDFAAGIQKRAPVWMQKLSLEWFYRLLCNPKRLFKRYLITNSFFILILMFEVLKMTISKICRHKIFRR
ncbi:MAG: WecB/TagA/CpsF family glycosyltransferase [Fibrobacter sp.]|nr:WecB/TagA/CpsF family glycosyltransferase [Fibrobacter sp.]